MPAPCRQIKTKPHLDTTLPMGSEYWKHEEKWVCHVEKITRASCQYLSIEIWIGFFFIYLVNLEEQLERLYDS